MIRAPHRRISRLATAAAVSLFAWIPTVSAAADGAATPVDFNRDVRPILSG